MRRSAFLVLPACLIAVWAMLTAFRLVDPLFVPTPWAVVGSLVNGLGSGLLARDLLATTWRSLAGFTVAAIVGVPLGLLVGRIRWLAEATQPTVDFFRSIPATALFPLFLLGFGFGDRAKIAIVVYACSLVILVNTAYGAMQVKRARIHCAEVSGAGRWDVFWRIVVPESSPGIFAGLRIALSLSFVLIVVTEMFIGTTIGLGYRIMTEQQVYRTPETYAAIVLTGIIGYLANKLLLRIENHFLHWVGR